jgi:SpoVK/Ycf46/Vps4 family AAA+-type ATPase
MGYSDIVMAFQRAARVAMSKNSGLTTNLVVEELERIEPINYGSWDEAFVKLGASIPPPSPPTRSWKEIVGLDAAKITFHVLWDNIKNKKAEKFNTVLLWGTPGCGKTMFAEVAANISGLDPIIRTGSQFIAGYIGQTQERINEFFDNVESRARVALNSNPPTGVLVFIDEADPLLVSREAEFVDVTVFDKDAVKTFISRIGGFKSLSNVIFILSTNYPSSMDDAVARRLNYHVFVGPPNEEGYKRLWKYNLEREAKKTGEKLSLDEKEYEQIAKLTCGRYLPSSIVGDQSIIKRIVQNAAGREINLPLIETAIDEYNPGRDTMTIKKYEKRRTELPTNLPIFDRQSLTIFIAEHGDELGITATVDELLDLTEVKSSACAYPVLKDVVGMAYEKASVYSICEQLLENPKWLQGKPPVLLLWGPPGTGKTFFMKAVSNTLTSRKGKKFNFYLIEGGQDLSVKELERSFDTAKGSPPSILFIDEAERVLPANALLRGDVVSFYLQKVQGFEQDPSGILVVLATNRPWEIDERALSRVYSSLEVPLPSFKDLTKLWRAYLEKHDLDILADKVDFKKIAAESDGISPRKIDDICSKVSLASRLVKKKEITTEDIVSYVKDTPRNIGKEECQEFKSNAEYAAEPVLKTPDAINMLKNRLDLHETLGITREDINDLERKSGEEGEQNDDIKPPILPPPSRRDDEFRSFQVKRSSDIAEVSRAFMRSLLYEAGLEEVKGIMRADMHIKRGDGTVNAFRLDLRVNETLNDDEMRLPRAVISNCSLSTDRWYPIRLKIATRGSL